MHERDCVMLLHARHKLNEPGSLLAIISLPLLSSLNEPVRLHTTLYQVTYLYLSTWCILSALLPRASVPLQAAPACSLDPQVQQVCIIHLLLTLNNAGKVAPLKPSDLLAMRAPDPLVSLSLSLSVCIYHQRCLSVFTISRAGLVASKKVSQHLP